MERCAFCKGMFLLLDGTFKEEKVVDLFGRDKKREFFVCKGCDADNRQ